MILHIPHAATDTLGKSFLCDVALELARMTDHATDLLFDYPGATKIVCPVSRLVCDVERFEDDRLEVMAGRGMGVCYTTNSFGEPLRALAPGEREEIIARYYRPHHARLAGAVAQELAAGGTALVVDCHSFPDLPMPCELSQTTPRPDICIGSDPYHTPPSLLHSAVTHFETCGYRVKVNDPYSGAITPVRYYGTDARVQAIMIEVNRKLYQDSLDPVQRQLCAWFDAITHHLPPPAHAP